VILLGQGLAGSALLPALVLAASGVVCLVLSRLRPDGVQTDGPEWVAALGATLAAALALFALGSEPSSTPALGLASDGCSAFFTLIVALVTLGAVVLVRYSEQTLARPGHICGLLLLSAAGLTLLACARILPTALAGAVLAAAPLPFAISAEGESPSLSAILVVLTPCGLLALALGLLTAVSDSPLEGQLPRLDQLVLSATSDPTPATLAAACVTGALACALALGLLAYGASRPNVPPAVAAWLGAPLAGISALAIRTLLGFRFLGGELELAWDVEWRAGLAWFAVVVTTLGHLQALRQRTLQGVAVWLMVGQAGTLGLGLTAPLHSEGGVMGVGGAAVAFQVLTLSLTHLGILAVAQAVCRGAGETLDERLSGLGQRNLWLTGFLGLLLASAVGLPPTLGFAGKLDVLLAGLGAGFIALSAGVLLSLVLAAWVALRVLRAVLTRPCEATEPLVASQGLTVVCASLAFAVLWLGLSPAGLVGFTQRLQLLAG
jgi:NADH-quinone oxidoreductase subunit N